jgi:hypothetical protein
MKNLKLIYSSSWAASLAIAVTAIITIWGELSPALKGTLKDFTGHHWISKSLLVVLVYLIGLIVFYFVWREITPEALRKSLIYLNLITIISVLAVFLFFVWHYLGGI